MTFATLILDSLSAGLLLIAAGSVSDFLNTRQHRHAARHRGPHLRRAFPAARGRSTWAQ